MCSSRQDESCWIVVSHETFIMGSRYSPLPAQKTVCECVKQSWSGRQRLKDMVSVGHECHYLMDSDLATSVTT